MDIRGMTFLITGISGFVGPYLASHLLERGHIVYGLAHTKTDKCAKGVKYLHGDLRNINDLVSLQSYNFAGVFHLAALTHPPTSFKEPRLYFETNALGTVNLCEVLGENSIIMQCSSPEVYGVCPQREIFESFPMNPVSPYAVSKAASDLYILERTKSKRLKAFITRAGSHTGAGRPSCYSISSDAAQIIRIKRGLQKPVLRVGNINSQRAVMDVRDVVAAYYKLMIKYILGGIRNGDIFHISGHNLQTIEYYIDLMMNLANVKAEKVADKNLVRRIDIPVQILNSDKTRSIISWKPKIPIEETLGELLDYWEKIIDGN
ncbi:MAG: GDP-mannose 4,6-dehydratase [bacterium]